MVVTSIVRVVILGNAPVAADDALYVGVGRELWSLQEPLTADGGTFTIHSWLYPLMTGGASHLFDGNPFGRGDPFTGPRLLGWTLGTAALALAVLLGYRFARGWGAIATALVLLATPLLWTVVPSTMVDVALMAAVVGVLLALDRPTPGRMVLGGVLAGVALLAKETSALFVLLPLGYLGAMPRPEWRRLALRYLIAFALTVGWWFVVVLVIKGQIFPLEGFRQASDRDRLRVWSLDWSGVLLVAAFLVGWLLVAIVRRHEPRARMLVIAGVAFVPAAVVSWYHELALRQFSALALLSCVALGVATVDVSGAWLVRVQNGPGRRLVPAVVGLVLLLTAISIGLTQDRTSVAAPPGGIEPEIAAWIADRPGDPRVATTFAFKTNIWSRITGDVTLIPLAFEVRRDPPDLAPAVWVDWHADRYNVLARRELVRATRDADYLLLTGPHRLGPIGLATWLQTHGPAVGIEPVAHFGPPSRRPWAYVYLLKNPRAEDIPTIGSTTAVERMVAADAFAPRDELVIAGSRGGFLRLGREIPIDDYQQLPAPLR